MHSLDMEIFVDKELTLKVLLSIDAQKLFTVVDWNRSYLRRWLPWLDHSTKPEHTELFIDGNYNQYRTRKGFSCGLLFFNIIIGMCRLLIN